MNTIKHLMMMVRKIILLTRVKEKIQLLLKVAQNITNLR